MMISSWMILIGTVWLLLLRAAEEVDHSTMFFAVSKALRSVFPVPLYEEDPDMLQILSREKD